MIGGLLAPGNGLALLKGRNKLALGLTAGGALIGSALGYKIGRGNALSRYDHKEYIKSPEYKANVEKELKLLQNLPAPKFPSNYSYLKGIGLEPIVFRYFDWLKGFYNRNWHKWYKSADLDSMDGFLSFQQLFLYPADEKSSLSDFKRGGNDAVMILYDAEGGSDHQFLYWNKSRRSYSFPFGSGNESNTLVGCLTNYVSQFLDFEYLNNTQRRIIRDYLNEIKRI